FASLTGAVQDNSKRLMNGGRPVVGALAFGPKLGQPEGPLNAQVHSGAFEFSDDGYVLAYAGDVTWSDNAENYVGALHLFSTLIEVHVATPSLANVSELGPIVGRAFFAIAPDAQVPGLYFVSY